MISTGTRSHTARPLIELLEQPGTATDLAEESGIPLSTTARKLELLVGRRPTSQEITIGNMIHSAVEVSNRSLFVVTSRAIGQSMSMDPNDPRYDQWPVADNEEATFVGAVSGQGTTMPIYYDKSEGVFFGAGNRR
ncbi:MAG: hypothetical protein ABEI52_04585, partial [Halobacteriaceae archaeon]